MKRWFLYTVFLAAPFLAGCGSSGPGPGGPQGEVSGKVLFKGKPLPGGMVTFMGPAGMFGNSRIGEDGSYQLTAPVGEVKITVDNRMLAVKEKPGEAALNPSTAPRDPIKGKYVRLPDKYYSAETSGLTYTVTKGSQSFDVNLQ